jgi:aryl-alcohol dehydrogenase-like predicted oxidoreductase
MGTGDVSLARSASRNVDVGDVTRALHAALAAGLRVVDVAPEPDSEQLVGEAVRALRLRDEAFVVCRVPALASARDVLSERLPVRYVQDRVEAALRATRLDVLPLVLLQVRAFWRSSTAWPELLGMCARLAREGKLLHTGALVGAIEEDTPQLVEDGFAAIAVELSLCARAAEPVIAAAKAKEVAVLARHPLAGGALAGTLGPGVRLAIDDDRRVLDDRMLERMAVLAAKLAPLVKQVPPAARSCDAARAALEAARRPPHIECDTLAELALRFVLDRGVIALPRLHRADHVTPALLAGSASPLSTSAHLFSILDELEVSSDRQPA